jgi:hypothetical protein
MNSLSLNMLYYGQQTEIPERLPLRAGPMRNEDFTIGHVAAERGDSETARVLVQSEESGELT